MQQDFFLAYKSKNLIILGFKDLYIEIYFKKRNKPLWK